MPGEQFSFLDLSREDIAAMPARLRKKIAKDLSAEDRASGHWLLVGSDEGWLLQVLARSLRALPARAAERRARVAEENILRLMDVLIDDAPRNEIDSELERDNARLRATYLRDTPTLTSAEVRGASGLAPKNKSEPASRWKREGKIFAVRVGGKDHYPAFQFADGEPIPALKKILSALPDDLTSWQTALWFASGNGWLDGAAPQDCLRRPNDVVAAAEHLAAPAIG